ncbi:hypothetical protein CKO25_20225 [Thiocapsa imhoffii]|uniref:DUF302 domain-containing protein n=1 Tax=Thiocapsa imhoffii TaxID=382777 RepID=A0A9X1BAF3_9GAMM|nr:DUF302 domain-containing protein [Thiocapsa imhoffii]MBK1646907.1 hypothetical protein [Thiocapsa imhoffii]
MKRNTALAAVGGFTLGIGAMALVAFAAAPSLMIVEDDSLLGFEDTIETLKTTAFEKGWKIPTVHRLDDAVKPAGFEVNRVAVIELCQPEFAGRILSDEHGMLVTSMMPCRVSVYETADGRTIVSRMNTRFMAHTFGGTIAEVMAEATLENEAIIASVIN